MADYISRPRRVKAFQYDGTYESFLSGQTFLRKNAPAEDKANLTRHPSRDGGAVDLSLNTPYLNVTIEPTNWLIVNQKGAVFMAEDEAFRESYRPADDADPSEVLDPEGGTNERPLG